jgi:hypothetical protein
MADELARLRAAFVARMQEIGAAPNDPRLAPLMAQMHALMAQQVAAARQVAATGNVAMLHAPAHAATRDDKGGRAVAAALAALPPRLSELVQAYVQSVSGGRNPAAGVLGAGAFFMQAPALSDSEAGRALLELPPADKAAVMVATYAGWASERYGGPEGGALRRIVSDLLRGKLELDDAQAVELTKAAVREGFSYSSFSPNVAVAGALKRHIETKGSAPRCTRRSPACARAWCTATRRTIRKAASSSSWSTACSRMPARPRRAWAMARRSSSPRTTPGAKRWQRSSRRCLPSRAPARRGCLRSHRRAAATPSRPRAG